MANTYRSFAFVVVWGIVSFFSCQAALAEKGFHAHLDGAKIANIDQPGYLTCQPGVNGKPDTLVISDGSGARSAGITFVIPVHLATGTYSLSDVSPVPNGQKPMVRVDIGQGENRRTFKLKQLGNLTLTTIPGGYVGDKPVPADGSFNLQVENAKGAKIHAIGSFMIDPPSKLELLCSKGEKTPAAPAKATTPSGAKDNGPAVAK